MLDYLMNIYYDKHFFYVLFAYLFTFFSFFVIFISAKISHKNTIINIKNKKHKK